MIASAASLSEPIWLTSTPGRACSFPCSSAVEWCIQAKNIHEAHALSRSHGLNDKHFGLFLKHFREALEEVGVNAEKAEKIIKLLESRREAVLNP